jgi:hypothetical protein
MTEERLAELRSVLAYFDKLGSDGESVTTITIPELRLFLRAVEEERIAA